MFQSDRQLSFRGPLLAGVLIGSAVMAGVVKGETPDFVPSDQTAPGQRVDIAEGAIDTREFLRFLADFTGVAVIVDAASAAQLEEPITLVAAIRNADGETVTNLLEANGWQSERTTLPGGKEIIQMSHSGRSSANAGTPGRRRSSRPGVEMSSGRRTSGAQASTAGPRTTPDVSSRPIFELRAGGLVAIEESTVLLVERGVAPDAWSTVVARLESVKPSDAIATLLAVVSPGGRVAKTDLVVTQVRGTQKVILAGKASHVDHALRLLGALDDPTSPERVSAVVEVEHDDVEKLARYINRLLDTCGPRRRAPVNVVGDARSSRLIVEAVDPADLESVRLLLSELGAMPEPGAAQKTHIYRLKHIEATDVASKLVELFGAGGSILVPHREMNSLLIQAPPKIFDAITAILHELDAPSGSDGAKGGEG